MTTTIDKKVADAIALLSRLGYTVINPNQSSDVLEAALRLWLEYKKEKGQTYKPRGLMAVRSRLFNLSGGDPKRAMEIVEFSMGNNYAGLFAPKANNYAGRNDTDNIRSKVEAILAE